MRHPAGVIELMERNPDGGVDMTGRYSLWSGARVIPRAPDSVQIGTDPPRCVMLANAPREALDLLRSLDGGDSLGAVLTAHDADPLVWSALLTDLLRAELLVPVRERVTGGRVVGPAHLAGERSALVHRHGERTAERILQTRDDALVVLHGTATVTRSIATTMAAAGVGHIHIDVTEPGASLLRRSAARSLRTGLTDDFPTVRVHQPASHQLPTIAVLAAAAVPDLGLAAAYTRQRVPHLSVTAGPSRTVVGPLVLPGRSSCLSCAHRHRTDRDPGWPVVADHLADDRQPPPAALAATAAAMAATALLQHIDGLLTPTTVDGTLEWHAEDEPPRRRTWALHPRCGCRG
jgi:hypothetical protein